MCLDGELKRSKGVVVGFDMAVDGRTGAVNCIWAVVVLLHIVVTYGKLETDYSSTVLIYQQIKLLITSNKT